MFLMLVHLARMHPLGNQVEVTAHHLLKAMSWCTGSADYLRLRQGVSIPGNRRDRLLEALRELLGEYGYGPDA